ncbi:xanthine dehydrogenase accessory protein XdhC [Peteryoungia desertarenae]|uniref:Xanthine dehydrogenase accessory protein XdhC n=1 Tax=Peteryoungia desertarenae TaxID=1813451 RepID=A0ABX6QIV0_9HYPH|nr:xanthine dehydrogenase accessory protein XdhC [Peteryoungia desertarenae]QLF68281.1 xanthine dehydrogenase accessory protein XdhC [Peteryoungia desertarenae]
MMVKDLRHFLAAHSASVLVEVAEAKGSTPRDAGTIMLVAPNSLLGTIGGGQLEYLAIDHARRILAGETLPLTLDIPLGPEIGQCCGGRTLIGFRVVDAGIAAEVEGRLQYEMAGAPEVMVFGAGHVGLALARALAPLPLKVTLIDSRPAIDGEAPRDITFRRVAMPEAEVGTLQAGSAVVILTHDHALDFLVAREALSRGDLAYVGMIGSKTKRATFSSFLRQEGLSPSLLDQLTLPIGGSDVRDKRPAVIAALVAAELLGVLLKKRP